MLPSLISADLAGNCVNGRIDRGAVLPQKSNGPDTFLPRRDILSLKCLIAGSEALVDPEEGVALARRTDILFEECHHEQVALHLITQKSSCAVMSIRS